jgi:predicted HTH domain antitoxin
MYDRGLSVDEAQALARRMTSLGLYVSENVSLGYCTEIAGMQKVDFICFLGTYKVSIFRYDDLTELDQDFANA